MALELTDAELATAATACRAMAHQEGERAKKMENPGMRQPIENAARRFAVLAQFRIANSNTAARGINDAGVIVGFTGSGVGFVGNEARGFQPLVQPGGDAAGAIVACGGINNLRHVICEVTDALGNNRAFIGSPDD